MEKDKKLIISLEKGVDFKNIFERVGLTLEEEELQKTTVLVSHYEKAVQSFVTFTTDDTGKRLEITHGALLDDDVPALFAALDDYCRQIDIHTIVVSIPKEMEDLLADFKRAGYNKLCDGEKYTFDKVTGKLAATTKTYDLMKEVGKKMVKNEKE